MTQRARQRPRRPRKDGDGITRRHQHDRQQSKVTLNFGSWATSAAICGKRRPARRSFNLRFGWREPCFSKGRDGQISQVENNVRCLSAQSRLVLRFEVYLCLHLLAS
jgi:hypothetical protein